MKQQIIEQMPLLLERLITSPLQPWEDLGSLPKRGIYVFYENGQAIYVGRTNRMRERIKEHGRQRSNHNSAPFAFNLAKEIAEQQGVNVSRQRAILGGGPVFADLFTRAKNRVSQMSVRVIEIEDPIVQTIFEVYASMGLKTPYNSFDTH